MWEFVSENRTMISIIKGYGSEARYCGFTQFAPAALGGGPILDCDTSGSQSGWVLVTPANIVMIKGRKMTATITKETSVSVIRGLMGLGILMFLASAGLPNGSWKDRYEVHIKACIYSGVELGCLLIKDPKDGKVYNITSAPAQPAKPGATAEKPKPGSLVIDLYGNVCKDCVSTCMQGQSILKDIKWSYTKQRCPEETPRGD
jgi:hypothetical protein